MWQTDISGASLDPNSGLYLTAYTAVNNGGFVAAAPTTYEYINQANNETPLLPVKARVSYHTPYTPEPWEASFYIETLSDAHGMVLQTDDCQYYESYDTSYTGGSSPYLTEQNGGMVQLNEPFVRLAKGGYSSASGIQIGMLAVRPEELTAGVIPHAIGWNAVAHALSQTACVSPAGETDCTDDLPYSGPSGDTPMPYGAHARLKASFNISSFPREAQIVAEAMKTYGLYVYDTGCCNTVPFVNDSYGAPVWTSADAAALKTITPSDMDIVEAP